VAVRRCGDAAMRRFGALVSVHKHLCTLSNTVHLYFTPVSSLSTRIHLRRLSVAVFGDYNGLAETVTSDRL
jgi:hypothetical protein